MSVQSFSLPVPKVKKRRWGKPKPGESLKMLAAGSLAFAKAYSSVEKLEHELEAEIQRDKDQDPKQTKGIHKWRRKGGKWLLSKYMLLFIVVLNIIDCALVLGELIFDLHHVKDILFESQMTTSSFITDLKDKYPEIFMGVKPSQIDQIYQVLLLSNITWFDPLRNSVLKQMAPNANNSTIITEVSSINASVEQSDIHKGFNHIVNQTLYRPIHFDGESKEHTGIPVSPLGAVFVQESGQGGHKSALSVVGYVFHKISLTISVILVLWIFLKIICFGRHLLDRKLEMFDTFVILTSFIVDMIFVKGLAMYSLQDFVFILAFMLPWRVIRVTNSLVVAVKDHEHFRLKMLFTQKKKIEHDMKQTRADRDNYKEQVEALKKLCLSEGIDDWKIFQSLARQSIRPGGKGAMGSFASLAFGAFSQKTSSFWSVLGTPRMRRGKSMEFVDNKISTPDNCFPNNKRHSKGKILSFLGSSTDFFRGKVKNGHNLSIDSDPGLAAMFLKHNSSQNQNGHVGKRLIRGETIDTASSTDSLDCVTDRVADIEDYSRQGTVDSSIDDPEEQNSNRLSSHDNDCGITMQRAHSEESTARPPLRYSIRVRETSPRLEKSRSVSINGTETIALNNMLKAHASADSDDCFLDRKEDV